MRKSYAWLRSDYAVAWHEIQMTHDDMFTCMGCSVMGGPPIMLDIPGTAYLQASNIPSGR